MWDTTKEGKKGTGKTNTNTTTKELLTQVNLIPASYTKVAAKVTDTPQGSMPAKTTRTLPGITEVTVIRTGGHLNPLTEQHI